MLLAILASRSSRFLPPCPGPEQGCGDRCPCLRVSGEGSHLLPDGYLMWHPQRVCNPCLSCPALLNIQWLSTIPCHPPAYFLCYFTHCETSTRFISWGEEWACPTSLSSTLCRILSGNSHSPGKSFALIPGISVKAQFWEKMVTLLCSGRVGSRCPPAACASFAAIKPHQKRSLAEGGHTSYAGELPKLRRLCT